MVVSFCLPLQGVWHTGEKYSPARAAPCDFPEIVCVCMCVYVCVCVCVCVCVKGTCNSSGPELVWKCNTSIYHPGFPIHTHTHPHPYTHTHFPHTSDGAHTHTHTHTHTHFP